MWHFLNFFPIRTNTGRFVAASLPCSYDARQNSMGQSDRRVRRGQCGSMGVRVGFLSTLLRLDYRNLEEQLSDGKIANVSLPEIKTAIEQLSFEERAELAAWLHGSPQRVRPVADWKDDEWDEQMKRDIVSGKLDNVLREVEQHSN